MRPPGPEPSRPERSTPFSAAILRASGLAFTRTSLAAATRRAGCGATGRRGPGMDTAFLVPAAGFSAFGAGAEAALALAMISSKFAGASSPSSRTMASGAFSGAFSPAFTMILKIVPSKKHGISIVALSVSTSATESPVVTLSPSLTIHLAIVPSVMVSLSLGISMILGMAEGDEFFG